MPLLIITSFGALIWMNLSTTIKGATPVLQAAPEIDLRIFKSWSNLRAAHALLFLYYELRRIHGSLSITQLMAAGIKDHVWGVDELISSLRHRWNRGPRPAMGACASCTGDPAADPDSDKGQRSVDLGRG
jgi:hypothetical protein